MITSPHNEKLKRIRKLRSRRERERTGLFVAEGEDLVEAAAAAGARARAGPGRRRGRRARAAGRGQHAGLGDPGDRRLPPALGGSRAGELSVYLHGVGDPGNVGTIIRAAHALCDGPVVLGPGCADPYSPKAVRASMGSVFARPPARAELAELTGHEAGAGRRAPTPLGELEARAAGRRSASAPSARACRPSSVGGRRRAPGSRCGPDGPDSLNVAMAATVALYELAT